ncbi:cytochrome c maturation protein CcmE [Marinicella sp. S1101]|uniref:cytochrome c maturation protein CcmE n=1 Tax=Marinicella marina TaxID=2996016 RepID=UPI002260C1FF|nr:cytochrome c maturation protein CcmE [Marinicella marina]MCX7554513.1 cytochrome c maturation protein CcmE [Marinicella marina]MDJ1140664.1 cytochrome c maturation protein CcmE [Marinicella marina]
MTPTRKKRLILVLMVALGVSVAVAIFLTAFRDNIMFFKSPTEVAAQDYPENRNFRLGGMVKDGSMSRIPNSLKVQFVVTDFAEEVKVEFEGILPDLFREGQGVVTIGKMRNDDLFVAEEVLAKHDENYMPPEVADALEAAKKQQSNYGNYKQEESE